MMWIAFAGLGAVLILVALSMDGVLPQPQRWLLKLLDFPFKNLPMTSAVLWGLLLGALLLAFAPSH